MGFNGDTLQDLWKAWRHEFPVTRNLIYLNHAAVAPLSARAAQAMKSLTDDVLLHGSIHFPEWAATYSGFRKAAATLCGAVPEEIATVKNTSEGIATVALGFPWERGDKIVAFREEFPANLYVWQKLAEERELQIEGLSCFDPLDKIAEAARGARLLTISFVQYLSGLRADLEAIGEICEREGVFFFVDAIQGFGAFPLDVRAMKIHAFAADGHKWLLGPEGCGVLYVQREWQERIRPVEFGWTNVAAYADYSSRKLDLRDDAGRYECGTLNTVGMFGLRASMELLLEIGVDRIGAAVQALADQLAAGAASKGYEVLGTREGQGGAGIVSIRKDGVDARAAYSHLKDNWVMCAPRQGWLRMAPHFYISPEEIARVVDLLP